jgi:transcriptional regulator with XRE-family HTH domain
MMDTSNSATTFGQWLQTKYGEYVNWYIKQHAKVPSMAIWAKHLGIRNTNLSQYMNDNRRPDMQQADLLAEKLGPEVYDRLGLPRRMPRDPELYFLAEHFVSDLTASDRADVIALAKERIAKNQRRPAGNNNMAYS